MSITTNWFARDLKMRPGMMAAKNAKAYLKALLKGDVDARDIVIASAKEWWASVFPARERP